MIGGKLHLLAVTHMIDNRVSVFYTAIAAGYRLD
jgi:hypothetical protein